MRKATLILSVLLVFLLILTGCNAGSVTLEDGKIKTEGITVDFGENNLTDNKLISLKASRPKNHEADNGLTSDLYEMTLDMAYAKPVTVSMTVPSSFKEADDSALLIGIGVGCEYDDGSTGTEYFYFPAVVKDSNATVSFVPKDMSDAILYMGANLGSATSNNEMVWNLGLFSSSVHYGEGHFTLYYPTKIDNKFFTGLVGYDGIEALLSDLEEAYAKFEKIGYVYGEDDFPMNVHVKKISDAGSYHSLFGDITLNTDNFKSKYEKGALNSLLWHEFFHYVQGCYTGIFSSTEWIDEATSSYYEARAKDTSFTSLTNQYFEKQFVSALPLNDTAQDGYARSPLITFLSQKKGNDSWIRTVYENGGTHDAFIQTVGNPSEWAHEYYVAMARGEIGQYNAFQLHKNLSTDVYGNDVGSSLKLNIPKSDDLKSESEDVILGTAELSMSGQGCRMIAITVENNDLKNLPDGIDPEVECKGAQITVLSAIGRNIKKCGTVLKGLKDSADDNMVYLIVLTSESVSSNEMNFEIKIKLPVKKTDFSGTYEGILNVLETNADIKITAVVTYEKDFGDGAYYNILCTNDDTQSKYINGSYFVRANGEANISGADFKFASDGTSFSAAMMDFNNKVWGTIDAYR
ncbi:MAG: hypothetical protein KA982_00995 [Clostridia bacterium]|nr:hypothetical protein [Clostridia bacterium]